MLTTRQIYEFDEFRVDTGQFLLSAAGSMRPISPTVFKILLVLLERAGQTVTKEELMKYVWPDSFVEEGNLNRNVSTLRKVLHEKPSDHKYIETIPKTGYRFIAPVRVIDYQPPTSGLHTSSTRVSNHVVGRESERDALRRAYEQAQKGQGGIFCISGDVGMGKTILIDAFLDDLVHDGQTFHLARGRCSDSFTECESFMPWIEGLSSLAEEPTISTIMSKAAPSWHREITHTGSAVPRSMKRELLDFCRQITPSHPLIVVIDDLHWADAGTIDLLAHMAPRLEALRVLVIVCYRLVEMKVKSHPFLRLRSDLLSRDACTEIQLAPLNQTHIAQYLALDVPKDKSLHDLALLHAKSEGNPLLLRELLRGQNRPNDSTHHMIQARLERLDDTHRQLLGTASVQGREFDSAVLSATMQLEAQDVEETLHDLDEIHGLIQRIREEELPDGKFTVRYRFVYTLYQEACYRCLAGPGVSHVLRKLGQIVVAAVYDRPIVIARSAAITDRRYRDPAIFPPALSTSQPYRSFPN
jgi:DNA-binding winged helix-turn-helix (wHTH) protein